MPNTSKMTLCCDCKRTGYGDKSTCPWERSFTPVPGWEAVPTKLLRARKDNGKPIYDDSFRVKRCPLFIKDKR